MAAFVPDPQSVYAPGKTYDASKGAARSLRIVFIPWEEGSPEAKEWKEKSEQWNLIKPDKFVIVYYTPGEKAHKLLAAASSDPTSSIYIRGHGSPGANSLKANVGDEQRSLAITDVCTRLIGMGLQTTFAGAIKFHSCYSATIFTDQSFSSSLQAANKSLKLANDMKAYQTTGLPADLKEAGDKLAALKAELVVEQNRWWKNEARIQELTILVARREGRVKDLQKQGADTGADAYIRERELRVPTKSSIALQGATIMRAAGFVHCSFYGYLGPMESLYSVDASSPDKKEMHKFVSLEGLTNEPHQITELTKTKVGRASVVRVRIQ